MLASVLAAGHLLAGCAGPLEIVPLPQGGVRVATPRAIADGQGAKKRSRGGWTKRSPAAAPRWSPTSGPPMQRSSSSGP
ncbi:hypothetical protein WMF30_01370 [Sorangium sp. So ce134]